MANKKISALNQLTSPDPNDVLPIVNSGETKKITISSLEEELFNQNTGSLLTSASYNGFIEFYKGDGTTFELSEPLLSREETGSFFKSASISSEPGQDMNTQRMLFEIGNETTISVDMADFLVRGQSGSFFKSASISYGENTQLHLLRGNETSESIDLNFITPSQTGSLVNTTYGLFNQTGSSTPITGSTAEASLIGGGVGTLLVPANAFQKGDAYHAIIAGISHFYNNDTVRIKIKADSQILVDTGNITLTGALDKRYKLEIFFSIDEVGTAGNAIIFTAGTFMYTKDAASEFQGINFGTENSTTFDTTVDNTLEITAQFSNAQNGILSRIFTLHKTY